ncbi:MAG: hypothetical protein DWH91_11035 [Planctomycetota bacterium]|nr:MAG: hypothetical protein DWH91_11035 [Planctomycetota bacterium]
MIIRRRLLLQITPILDMLLLVMFLQFMDMKQRTLGMASEATATAVALEEADARLAATQAALIQTQQDAERTREQQATIAGMVAEVFHMTPAETKSLLRDLQPAGAISPATLDRLGQLAAGSPAPVVEHLITYGEIRKRCDLWELHIDGNNVAHLTSGDHATALRVNLSDAQDAEIEEFANALETTYRGLPQPKYLVIVLFSFDRAARLTVTEGIGKALPRIVDRLTKASVGLTRFEYAELGMRGSLVP